MVPDSCWTHRHRPAWMRRYFFLYLRKSSSAIDEAHGVLHEYNDRWLVATSHHYSWSGLAGWHDAKAGCMKWTLLPIFCNYWCVIVNRFPTGVYFYPFINWVNFDLLIRTRRAYSSYSFNYSNILIKFLHTHSGMSSSETSHLQVYHAFPHTHSGMSSSATCLFWSLCH